MKRSLTALLLLAAMGICLLTACAKSESDVTTAATEASTTTVTTEAPAPAIPDKIDLEGKTIVWLGSSVTYGSATGGVSMAEHLATSTGCKSYKFAVSGTTLVVVDGKRDSYVQRVKNAVKRPTKANYFVCQLSTNDASQNKPLGKISDSFNLEDFDTTTICGAIEYIIAFVKEKYNCPIAFYTGPKYNSTAYGKMVDALLEIQKKWDIYVLDFWNDPELSKLSNAEQKAWLKQYMADDIHPNEKGYTEWWTPAFEEFISTTMADYAKKQVGQS